MEAVLDTNLHALPATDALLEEEPLVQGPRRTQEGRPGKLFPPPDPGDQGKGDAGETDSQEGPAGEVHAVLKARHAQPIGDHPLRTLGHALHAEVAPLRDETSVLLEGFETAELPALSAGGAELPGPAAEGREPGKERQKGSQGAEVLTPETPLDPLQEEDPQEKEEGDQGEGEDGLLVGKNPLLQELIDRFRERGHPGGSLLVEGIEDPCDGGVEDRIHREGEPPEEKGEGIEEAHELEAEEGGGGDQQEEEILDLHPSLPHPLAPGRNNLVGGVEQCPQGADPPAEEPPQQEGEHSQEEGGKEEGQKRLGRQSHREGDQGVPPEEDVHRRGDLVLSCVVGQPEEVEEEAEKGKLCKTPCPEKSLPSLHPTPPGPGSSSGPSPRDRVHRPFGLTRSPRDGS